jgi:hypothetical protein
MSVAVGGASALWVHAATTSPIIATIVSGVAGFVVDIGTSGDGVGSATTVWPPSLLEKAENHHESAHRRRDLLRIHAAPYDPRTGMEGEAEAS